MAATQSDGSLEQANRLYWNSDLTVDEVVEELGISRNSLYSAIRPIPAGASCPECDERMVFTNRTNRSQDLATCAVCGLESAASELERGLEDPVARVTSEIDRAGETEPWRRWRDELAPAGTERLLVVGGGAALGLLLGVAAVRAARGLS